MTLPTRRLGRDGPKITTIGLGTWAIGGGGWAFGWGPQDDGDSLRTMRAALDHGINWFDTAAVYGLGHSEEVVGRFLRDVPQHERPLVFTKGGLVWDERDRMKDARRVLRPDVIRRQCEDSLLRLGVERIDLYQFHWPDEIDTPVEESWQEMMRLVDEGKVRWAGVSNFNVTLLERCERLRHVDSLQPPLSMIERRAAADVVPWSAASGTGVICYSPLQTGQLTEAFSEERVRRMAEDDWRAASSGYARERLLRNLALRDGLRPIAQRLDATVSAVALAWVLAWSGVTGAIVGARRPEQMDEWIGGASLVLSEEDLDEIAALIEQTGAGRGPARPA